MKALIVLAALTLLVPVHALAHGEDRPGPHGGTVRMTGFTHLEFVPLDERTFRLYLLDVQISNPTIRDSSVRVEALSDGASADVECVPEESYFRCTVPPGTALAAGKLAVESIRDGMEAPRLEIALPFPSWKADSKLEVSLHS